MQYVEFLRSRRLLMWWTGIFFSSFVLTVITAISRNLHIQGPVGPIPISALVDILFFGGIVLASFVAPGLHAEHTTLAVVWTRPVARSLTAWRYIGVDLLTIAAGLLVLSAVMVGQLAFVGVLGNLVWNSGTTLHFGLALGCIVMWYGLVSLGCVRFPERAGMIAGMSWIVFTAVAVLSSVHGVWPVLHAIAAALDYVDPLAYFGSSGSVHTDAGAAAGAAGELAPPFVRLILSYLIGVGALAATVRLWSTREA